MSMFDGGWGLVIGATIFVAITLFFFVVIVLASIWETQYVQPFKVPKSGEAYEPSSTAAAANAKAKKLGYTHGGLCHSKTHRLRNDFWLSSDQLTFAVIGSGTIAKIPQEGIWLYSRLLDDRILCSTNYAGTSDISGVQELRHYNQHNFGQLHERHQERLAEHEALVFVEDAALEEYLDIRRASTEALVAQGYAYFRDPERTMWRFTLKGALVNYVRMVWVAPAKAVKKPKKKRPT